MFFAVPQTVTFDSMPSVLSRLLSKTRKSTGRASERSSYPAHPGPVPFAFENLRHRVVTIPSYRRQYWCENLNRGD